MEIWKPVEGWEGLYEVSNLGRIKSLQRYTTRRDRGNAPMLIPECILKPKIAKNWNYRSANVCLYKDHIIKYQQISRLVAKAFIPNPENKEEVNHINNDALDNRVENLEWMTHRENIDYSTKQGRRGPKSKKYSTV